MKTEPDIEIDLQQTLESGGYDLLMIVSLGMIAFSTLVIAMTVSVMVS